MPSEKRKHEGSSVDNKAKKQWQQDPADSLTPFSLGIFITCVRGKESPATKDALDMLNDYAERHGLKLDDEVDGTSLEGDDSSIPAETVDIESSIAKELGSMKTTKQKKGGTLFVPLKTMTECVIFIKTAKSIDPVTLVHGICSEAFEKTARKTGGRFLRRMTPITASADSSLGGLKQALAKALPREFSTGQPLKFRIEPTFRNHNVLNREIVIPEVASAITALGAHTVDLKNYDVLVMVEVTRAYLGVSVVRDWEKFRKYNLSEIFSSGMDRENGKKKGRDESEVCASKIDRSAS